MSHTKINCIHIKFLFIKRVCVSPAFSTAEDFYVFAYPLEMKRSKLTSILTGCKPSLNIIKFK